MSQLELSPTESKCIYAGKLNLEGQEWDWCFFFNAERGNLNCSKCEHNFYLTQPISEA